MMIPMAAKTNVVLITRSPEKEDNDSEKYQRHDIWIYHIKDCPSLIYWFDGNEWILP